MAGDMYLKEKWGICRRGGSKKYVFAGEAGDMYPRGEV